MFVVLAVVALYRAWVPDVRWGFVVYFPCIAATVGLGYLLEKWITIPVDDRLRRRLKKSSASSETE